MSSPRATVFALLAALVGLSSCTIYNRDAEVRIHWQFARYGSCAEAGVSDVLVQLLGEEDSVETSFLPCEQGFVDIPVDLEPGDYLVTVLGFPPPHLGSSPTWIAERWVNLHGGFNEYTFVLERF